MNRIDHTKCSHEATPKARKTCRKTKAAQVVQDSKIGKAPQDWSEEAKAATTWVDAFPATPEPYRKRAIVVNFLMKDGTRKKVVFDRYGMNAELFTSAQAHGYSAERTVAQACSNAIAAVLEQYGLRSIESHSVHEIS